MLLCSVLSFWLSVTLMIAPCYDVDSRAEGSVRGWSPLRPAWFVTLWLVGAGALRDLGVNTAVPVVKFIQGSALCFGASSDAFRAGLAGLVNGILRVVAWEE